MIALATTPSYRWRGERVIEAIKWMRSPQTRVHVEEGGLEGEQSRANQVDASPPKQPTDGEERESRANSSVMLSPTTAVQVKRRESHRANQVDCAHHTAATGGEDMRDIEPIKCMCSPHSSYRWRAMREVIEPIKCMRSPHTSYSGEERESWSQTSVCAHPTSATGGEDRET